MYKTLYDLHWMDIIFFKFYYKIKLIILIILIIKELSKMNRQKQIPQHLWISILKFIEPRQYIDCQWVHPDWKQTIICHPEIKKWVSLYLGEFIKGFDIKSEEQDIRDDCGMSCTIYFLKNGLVLEKEEFEEIYNQQMINMNYHFSPYLKKELVILRDKMLR